LVRWLTLFLGLWFVITCVAVMQRSDDTKVGEERNHVMRLVEIGNEAFIEDLMLKYLLCYDGFLEGDHVISR